MKWADSKSVSSSSICGRSANCPREKIVNVKDRYTRWPKEIPIVEILAETTARTLLSGWIARFGTLVTNATDQGGNFESSSIRELTSVLGSHRIHSAFYHPQSNGMIEGFHWHLKSAIFAYEGTGWSDILTILLLDLRSAVKNDLNATSSQLVYDRYYFTFSI
ncbi:hypothetical protein AVEN_234571-1 [Araneus ventricosus]|uniref:Integrase catalytic domain-containing protein n=1 Tax=Araneus ventricosus TaxID=182803 RepID=A0A4Y2AAG1_ARAVE|nr:hypothetical protein AVEN_234571-1 [Araneus ventricosus]